MMTFDEQIGRHVFIYLRPPLLFVGEAEPLVALGAKVIGVEPSGIWIESEKLSPAFESGLWAAETEEMGPAGVGTFSISYFLPFSGIALLLAFSHATGEDK